MTVSSTRRISAPIACAAAALFAFAGQAAHVGNLAGGRSWNDIDFGRIKTTAIDAGHTIEANQTLSAANLANDTHLIVGDLAATPTAGELADLKSWVESGGILLLLVDSALGLPAANNIAAAIGSSLVWNGNINTTATLTGGNFATEGGPYDIVGESISASAGKAVVAGTPLAGNYLRFDQLGDGYVFGFADRLDHDTLNPIPLPGNRKLFLNILAGPNVPDGGSTLGLLAISLGALLLPKMRQRG